MKTPEEFNDIRPYDEEELAPVMEELIADPEFRAVAQYVMPQTPYDKLAQRLRACRSILEFQTSILQPLLDSLLNKCSKGFSLDSSELSDKNARHTYITNHRDIVTDSAFLNVGLMRNGFKQTAEIAIGDNLLIRPWIKKLVRLNKAFIVQRTPGLREMLASSAHLSRYIHYTVASRNSIWIAQREGRAKDSNDRTQDSILKMMAMGGEGNPADRLKQLNIVPIALSYEYDPCDFLKAKEFQQKRDNPAFKKNKADDLNSMKIGIYGFKGRILFRMADSINPFLENLPPMPKNQFFTAVAQHIDREIHSRYQLFPINYAAADLLTNTTHFAPHYTAQEAQQADNYFQQQLSKIDLPHPDLPFLRERLLTMYANPVFNQQAAKTNA